jgi:hypothetical protein
MPQVHPTTAVKPGFTTWGAGPTGAFGGVWQAPEVSGHSSESAFLAGA